MKSKFYITTAIPYANADPHIGFALEILYADVMARYQRLLGKDVYFLTGTDEHGQKMIKTAKEAGQLVEEFASEKSAKYQLLADQWNISTNNDFIRTTEDRHIAGAQEFWKKSLVSGDIYKKPIPDYIVSAVNLLKRKRIWWMASVRITTSRRKQFPKKIIFSSYQNTRNLWNFPV